MLKYTNTDYAWNKYNEGIVYKYNDGSKIIVTLEDYLSQNPDKGEKDFQELKKLSDSIYQEQARVENTTTRKNVKFNDVCLTAYIPSPEESLIKKIDRQEEAERLKELSKTAKCALYTLTPIQFKRYLMRTIGNLSVSGIAKQQGVKVQAVSKSIIAAKKKIAKFLIND